MENCYEAQAVADFIELVTTFSASRRERAVADLLKAKLLELGCTDVREDDAGQCIGGSTGNIHGIFPGTLPGYIMFCSHMDRGEILFCGDRDPVIRPELRDGRIYSDGSTLLAADDIAGGVAILTGLRRLRDSGEPHCSVEILFTVCEEDCALGSYYADYSRLRSKLAYAMDSNSNMGRIVSAAPSGAKLAAEFFGRGAHYGSAPENGTDAAQAAARVLLAVKQGVVEDGTVANFPVLHAGREATYGICEYAMIRGQAQSHDHQRLLDYIEYFESLCRNVAYEAHVKVKFDNQVCYRQFAVPDDSAVVRLASKALADMGVKSYTERGNACLDSHNFNCHGIQSVALAMGYKLNHSNREYQDVAQMLANGELVERIVREYTANSGAYCAG